MLLIMATIIMGFPPGLEVKNCVCQCTPSPGVCPQVHGHRPARAACLQWLELERAQPRAERIHDRNMVACGQLPNGNVHSKWDGSRTEQRAKELDTPGSGDARFKPKLYRVGVGGPWSGEPRPTRVSGVRIPGRRVSASVSCFPGCVCFETIH